MTAAQSKNRSASFIARGGLWVLAQAVVMLLAAAVPVITRHGGFMPRHPAQWFGVAVIFVGIVLVIAGARALGRALTPFPVPLENAGLRTGGIYEWVRHPIYAGVVIGALGWVLWCLSPLGLGYWLVVVLFFDRKAAHEERWLRRKYPEYDAYSARVKRLFPGVY